ncbi:ribosome rescue GTPase HflX [Alkanindiges illinoisensis]|uniref:GTPase HflX n=1 Tax=Alkanindiges illinoisensis TaxID=197183 RepID=A0A4Y7XFK1_9GAMM|nr:ribosome rescue GTPase HflX [Alkanindiges illinoisensis]TEU30628.1 GTPase HflX [Alkanindiges illinoisensis]
MEYFERHQGGERALLVHMSVYQLEELDVEEFKLLAQSAGADIVDLITGSRQRPDPKLFIGSGKAEEIAARVQSDEIDLVIFDHTLTPAQERNLERVMQCRVIDRTGLILDIFAQRARTHEGKLQVELAQLEHLSSRLVRGWTHLERQKGGIGLRGPGETQLETDRRLLRIRVTQLKERLEKVRQTRSQGRAARQKADVPTISLVGYTNAGKSTLFNKLANSDVYAANQLFATLDPTLRRLEWDGLGTVVLADTVGFVRNLPHSLVDSFRATLEETLEASLLLHVIDANSSEMHEQIEAVEAVLKEIGNNVPVLRVYNKIDASGDEPRLVEAAPNQPDRVYVSAYTGAGINLLKQAVQTCLMGQLHDFELTLPASAGKLRNQLYQLNVVRNEQTLDNGYSVLQVHLAQDQLQQLIGKAQLLPREVLPPHQAALLERPLEHFEQTSAEQAQFEPSDDPELAFEFDDENHSLITQEQAGQSDDALAHPLEKPCSSS